MSLIDQSKYLLLEFNSIPVIEYGSSTMLDQTGEDALVLVPSVNDKGLLLPRNSYLSMSITSQYENFRTNFSVGFWLNSVYKQDIIVESQSLSVIMPVVSISSPFVSNNFYDFNNGIFCISEKCVFTNFNLMILTILKEDGEKIHFESEIYETGSFNHFIFSVNSISKKVSLYMNGVESILTKTEEEDISSPMGTSGSSELFINNSIFGSAFQYSRNTGIVDDLFLVNDNLDEVYKISKIISDGFASYLNEAAGIFSEFVFNAQLSFFQHTKVSPPITSIGLSTGDLVAGTQDGLVLKGDSGYWNKKYNLSKESDLKQLSVVYSGSVEGDAKIAPGIGLVLIKNGIIIK